MNTRTKALLGILAAVVLALLVLQTPVLARVRAFAWDWWVGTIARMVSVGALDVTPDVMAELGHLRAEQVRLTAELKHYQRLQHQVGEVAFDDFAHIPALVSFQTADTFRSQYFLNRGTEDGVVVGAPVVTEGSILVGTISGLAPKSSVVQLLLHPATHIPAEVLHEEEAGVTRGLARGSSYTSVLLTTVPRDRKLSSGATIVTAAQETGLPYGLTIGMVGDIQSLERDAYQSATIDLPYDPDDLEAVTILVPRKSI